MTFRFDTQHRKALHVAASKNEAKKIEELLKGGADVDEYDYDFRTALTVAVRYGNVNAVRALLEGGADLNRDKEAREHLLGLGLMGFSQGSADDYETIEHMIEQEDVRRRQEQRPARVHVVAPDMSDPLVAAAVRRSDLMF